VFHAHEKNVLIIDIHVHKIESIMLTESQKYQIILDCERAKRLHPLQKKCPNGTLQLIALKFHCSHRTIQSIYKQYNNAINAGIGCPDIKPKKKGHCGRKSQFDEESANILVEVNRKNLGNLCYRDLALALEDEGLFISHTTVRNWSLLLGGNHIHK
jgi:hypothetical protein